MFDDAPERDGLRSGPFVGEVSRGEHADPDHKRGTEEGARGAPFDAAGNLTLPAEHPVIPEILPVLPLRDTVVYPFAVVPLGVGKERSIRLINDAMQGDRLVVMVAQKDADIENALLSDCFEIGTVVRIARLLRLPDGTVQIIVQGLERISVNVPLTETPYITARCQVLPEPVQQMMEVEALKRNAVDLFQRLVNLVQYLPDQLAVAAMNLDDPRQVVYLIAGSCQMDLALRQELLELSSVRVKLERLVTYLTRELDILELGKKIQARVQEQVGREQREKYLRMQLEVVKRELEQWEEDGRALADDDGSAQDVQSRIGRRTQAMMARAEREQYLREQLKAIQLELGDTVIEELVPEAQQVAQRAGSGAFVVPPVPRPQAVSIFVSHSHHDDQFGRQLVRDLRLVLGAEEAVWYDTLGGLKGGEAWWRKIVAELSARSVFIVVLSPDSVASRWVNDEIDLAWRQKNSQGGKQIIPVLYRHCEVREDLMLHQMVSFVPPKSYEQAFHELLGAIGVDPLRRADQPRTSAFTSARDERLLAKAPIGAPDHRLVLRPWMVVAAAALFILAGLVLGVALAAQLR